MLRPHLQPFLRPRTAVHDALQHISMATALKHHLPLSCVTTASTKWSQPHTCRVLRICPPLRDDALQRVQRGQRGVRARRVCARLHQPAFLGHANLQEPA